MLEYFAMAIAGKYGPEPPARPVLAVAPFLVLGWCAGFMAPTAVFGQNLIANWSFEDRTNCENDTVEAMWWTRPWYTPNGCTPDVFDADTTDLCGVSIYQPGDFLGPPQHGLRYAGGYMAQVGYITKEYIATSLSGPMQPGVNYEVKIHVRLADDSDQAVDRFGVYFDADSIVSLPECDVMPLVPQVILDGVGFITDEANWTELSAIYAAAGGEKHMAIGSFEDTTQIDLYWVGPGWPGYAYYYYDAVTVTPQGGEGIEELVVVEGHGSSMQVAWAGHGVVDRVEVFDAMGRSCWRMDRPMLPLRLPTTACNSHGLHVIRAIDGGQRAVAKWLR